MSMDKSAIEQIQLASAVDEANRKMRESMTSCQGDNDGSIPVAAVPESMKLHRLESYMPFRSRYRGSMTTPIINDFIRYVKDHQQTGSACFIDPKNMRAQTFFDLGDRDFPGHGEFLATLTLRKTSAYEALLGLNGNRTSQKTMAEWFEDWRGHITFYDNEGNVVDTTKAISATRRLTIEGSRKEGHEVQNFKSTKSALETIEASSDLGMPAGLMFELEPYAGLGPHDFDCRIAITTGEEAPRLVVRIKQLEAEEEKLSQTFMRILDDLLVETDVTLYRGKFSL